jgi:NADP-dependent 3-hydroxy acid dehydrogenase YdfG
MNLRDRVVVITGAGSGIGRATALAFAREGARIAACDVDQARLDALRADLGDRALLVEKVDVSNRHEMKTFADKVHAHTPAADVIVNNAGVAVSGTFLETSLDDWDWLLGINLKGVVHGCHYFVPKMVDRGAGGHVINIASIFGIYAPPGVTAYVASKFGVRGFSLSLREELAPHKIGVTAICPGMINTAIVADARTKASMAGRKSKVVETFKKGLSPDKVAEAILAAVHSNPPVRTVGTDARVVAALTRLAPRTMMKVGGIVQRRLSAV